MFGFLHWGKPKAVEPPPAFPHHWARGLERDMPLYGILPRLERDALHVHIQRFLERKAFEGCRGFEVDERERVLVAAHACLLLLGGREDVYPGLRTVLIYPEAFVVDDPQEDEHGLVHEGPDTREGESWESEAVVLSWDDVELDLEGLDGRNLLIHEFAHQVMDAGLIGPAGRRAFATWSQAFETAYEAHAKTIDRNRRTLLDPYGAESPAEFFAVASEAFFELPRRLRRREPRVYAIMREGYGLDPVVWHEAASGRN